MNEKILKTSVRKELFCGHKDVDNYFYPLSSGLTLRLCPDCNFILAGEILKQLAYEVFMEKNNKRVSKNDD
jgi:hypothetical protein